MFHGWYLSLSSRLISLSLSSRLISLSLSLSLLTTHLYLSSSHVSRLLSCFRAHLLLFVASSSHVRRLKLGKQHPTCLSVAFLSQTFASSFVAAHLSHTQHPLILSRRMFVAAHLSHHNTPALKICFRFLFHFKICLGGRGGRTTTTTPEISVVEQTLF